MKKSIKVSTGAAMALVVAAVLFLYWPLFPRSVPAAENDKPVDVVLVGAGVMSATLATYLQELQPDWKIEVFERLWFNVHFRNIHGHRGRFNETFHDEGDIDMVRALATYAEVGYDGMMMPDHVPGMDDPQIVDGKRVYTQRAENFAFAYGYIRGLIQSAQRLA